MKISISIPSYNYGDYIFQCLQSIKDQDYHDYEVLIADGGSDDNSLQIIDEFCKNDDRFSLVSSDDNGQSDAIVKSFAVATGDIFCFLNADDCFISSNVFGKVISSFVHYKKADIISFEGMYLDREGKYIKKVRLRYHPLDSTANMKYRTAVLQPATFWRRVVYLDIPIEPDSHYVFDVMFFYQAYQRFSWLDLSIPVAGHRLHGLNKSLQISTTRINELAEFEKLKFGSLSFRVHYLKIIAMLIQVTNRIPLFGRVSCKLIYLVVNSLSFLSFYRMPSI